MNIITTLCGSTRFRDEFYQVQKELSLAGEIVISFGHLDGLNMDGSEKKIFDELHLRKIDISDGIYVINPDGYIGESTWREIAYACRHNKKIRFLEPLIESTLKIQKFIPTYLHHGLYTKSL